MKEEAFYKRNGWKNIKRKNDGQICIFKQPFSEHFQVAADTFFNSFACCLASRMISFAFVPASAKSSFPSFKTSFPFSLISYLSSFPDFGVKKMPANAPKMPPIKNPRKNRRHIPLCFPVWMWMRRPKNLRSLSEGQNTRQTYSSFS